MEKNILPPPVRNSQCTDSSITIRPKKIGGNFVEVALTHMQEVPQSFQEKKALASATEDEEDP